MSAAPNRTFPRGHLGGKWGKVGALAIPHFFALQLSIFRRVKNARFVTHRLAIISFAPGALVCACLTRPYPSLSAYTRPTLILERDAFLLKSIKSSGTRLHISVKKAPNVQVFNEFSLRDRPVGPNPNIGWRPLAPQQSMAQSWTPTSLLRKLWLGPKFFWQRIPTAVARCR